MSTFEWAVVGILFFLVLLRLLVVTLVGFAIIRPVRDCPACFRPTVPIRMTWLARLSSSFEWRWCPECHWEGPARKTVAGRRVRAPGAVDLGE